MASSPTLSTTTTLQDNGPYSLNTGPHASRQFPSEVNLYSGGTFSRSFYLGPRQDQPLYAVSTHGGWSSKPDVVLHATADGGAKSPVMATYKAEALHLRASVVLPGGDKRTVTYTGPSARGRAFDAATVSPSSSSSGGGKREQFEWSTGWGGGSGSGSDASDMRGRRLVRYSTGETVATSAPAATRGREQFVLQFVGSGASGELGEEFAVMAVITALGMWDQSRKTNHNTPVNNVVASWNGGLPASSYRMYDSRQVREQAAKLSRLRDNGKFYPLSPVSLEALSKEIWLASFAALYAGAALIATIPAGAPWAEVKGRCTNECLREDTGSLVLNCV